jgi:hypothetical protein
MKRHSHKEIWLGRTFIASLLALFLVNAGLWLAPDAFPKAITVRSAGFAFPEMAQSGALVRSMLFAALLAAAGWLLLLRQHVASPDLLASAFAGAGGRWHGDISKMVGLLVFCTYLYLAYPPQISLTNFKILWVEWLGTDSKIRYVSQLLRDAFYNYPHLLQAIAGLLGYLSLQGILRSLGWRDAPAAWLALAACVSPIFLHFSGVGEDWLLVTAFTLAALWAYARRRWVWLAILLVVLGGVRLPAMGVLVIAATMTECLRAARLARRRKRFAGMIFARAAASSALLILVTAAAAFLGYIHFAEYGDDLALASAEGVGKRVVDGFVLTRLSGAYFAHALWALPPVVLAACTTGVFFAGRFVATRAGRSALVSAVAMGGTILSYELVVEHQFYYNYRYLALAFPIGLPALMFLLRRLRLPSAFVILAVVSLLFSSPGALPSALTGRLTEHRQLDHELYSCRRTFAPWLGPASVYVTRPSKRLANAVAYVKGPGMAATPWGKSLRKLRPGSDIGPQGVVLIGHVEAQAWLKRTKLKPIAVCRGWEVLARK